MRRLAVLSLHTSPLAQPGTGDGGGMNVYVRELSSALARAGVVCDVFTRSWSDDLSATVAIEPGLRVHHIAAGPPTPLPKESLPSVVDEFADGVLKRMDSFGRLRRRREPPLRRRARQLLAQRHGRPCDQAPDEPAAGLHLSHPRPGQGRVQPRGGARPTPHTSGPKPSPPSSGAPTRCWRRVRSRRRRSPICTTPILPASASWPPASTTPSSAPGIARQARRALALGRTGPLLLFVGRIQPLKGVEVAVRTLAALGPDHPDARLVIVGGPSGPHGEAEVDRVVALVDDLGLAGSVDFVPPRPHELLSTYYRAADVCLVPSRSESFGLVALEAAACGTPVVASDVGGLRSLIDHGRTGYLVEDPNAESFAGWVRQIVAEPLLAERLSTGAVLRARRYTWARAAHLLREIYAELTVGRLVECS